MYMYMYENLLLLWCIVDMTMSNVLGFLKRWATDE